MARKYVYGVYPTVYEAEEVVDFIVNQGVDRDEVVLVGSGELDYDGVLEFISYGDLVEEQNEGPSFFGQLFGWDDDDDEYDNIDLDVYRDFLRNNAILVLIDEKHQGQLQQYPEDMIVSDADGPNVGLPQKPGGADPGYRAGAPIHDPHSRPVGGGQPAEVPDKEYLNINDPHSREPLGGVEPFDHDHPNLDDPNDTGVVGEPLNINDPHSRPVAGAANPAEPEPLEEEKEPIVIDLDETPEPLNINDPHSRKVNQIEAEQIVEIDELSQEYLGINDPHSRDQHFTGDQVIHADELESDPLINEDLPENFEDPDSPLNINDPHSR